MNINVPTSQKIKFSKVGCKAFVLPLVVRRFQALMEPNHHVDKDISLSIYGCYGVVILGIEVQSVGRRGRSANDATVSIAQTASVQYSTYVTVSVVNLLFSSPITINQTHTHMHVLHMPCTHSCINERMHTHPPYTHTLSQISIHTLIYSRISHNAQQLNPLR